MNGVPRILASGFGYLEAARWRDGGLYFSDVKERKVFRMAPDGSYAVVLELPQRPSGLGWTTAGDLLVVGMEDNSLKRVGAGGDIHASLDLSGHAIHTNDMTVDARGNAYVTQFGYDLFEHAPPEPSDIVRIDEAGNVAHFGGGLVFPNGIVIAPDGKTLVVAESFSHRLTAFDVAPDGGLSNQRLFAQFGDPERDIPDGICMDSAGAVWAAMPFAGEFRRVLDGGTVTDRITPAPGAGTYCVDCILGGKDGRTLFMLVADTDVERLGNDWDSSASVQAVEVAIP